MYNFDFTQENLASILRAFEFYFPNEVAARDGKFSFGDLSWNDLSDFIETIERVGGVNVDLTSAKSIKDTVKAAQLAIGEKFEQGIEAEQKKVEANKPQDQEALNKNLEEREKTIKESEQKAKEQTDAEIKRREEFARQKQIIQDQYVKTQAAKAELQEKNIKVKVELPQTPVLSNEEKASYTILKELATRNPTQLRKEISRAIQARMPDGIKQNSDSGQLANYTDSVATQVVKNLRMTSAPPPDIETAVIASGAVDGTPDFGLQPTTQELVGQELNDLARIKLGMYQAQAGALDLIFGRNVRELIIGPSPDEIKVNFQAPPDEATHQLDFSKLNSSYGSILQNPIFSFAEGEAKSRLISFGKQQLASRLSSISSESTLGDFFVTKEFQGILTMLQSSASMEFVGAEGLPGIIGKFVVTFSPESSPLVAGLGEIFGIDFGFIPITSAITPAVGDILTVGGGEFLAESSVTTMATLGSTGASAITGIGTEAVTTTLTGTVAEVTTTAIGTEAGAAAGSVVPVPIVGTIIGAVIGFLVAKAFSWINDKLSKNREMFYAVPAAVIVGIFAGPIPGLAAGLGTFGLTAAMGTGIPTVIMSGLSGFFGALSAIWATFVSAIGGVILGIMLGFVALVVIILIIINSGAYVVPQGNGGSSGIPIGGTPINLDCKQLDRSLPPPAYAAELVACALTQSGLNPLFGSMIGNASWQNLSSSGVLNSPAMDALESSANVSGSWAGVVSKHLQCIGYVAATAGQAYGQSFAQIDACFYIANPPSGYKYISGTNGMGSGDFFVINGSGGCNVAPYYSPGHIGVVISVTGVGVNCADANEVAAGEVRAANGCFVLSQITGYLRKK